MQQLKAVFVGGVKHKQTLNIPNAMPYLVMPVPVDPMKYDESIRLMSESHMYDLVIVTEDEELAIYRFTGNIDIAEDITTDVLMVYTMGRFPRKADSKYVFELSNEIGTRVYQEAMKAYGVTNA